MPRHRRFTAADLVFIYAVEVISMRAAFNWDIMVGDAAARASASTRTIASLLTIG